MGTYEARKGREKVKVCSRDLCNLSFFCDYRLSKQKLSSGKQKWNMSRLFLQNEVSEEGP